MLDNPLRQLQDSIAFGELMKTKDGQSIAERIASLASQLEALPENQKIEFKNKFGDSFSQSLSKLHPEDDATLKSTVLWCFVLLLIIAGEKEKRQVMSSE